MELPSGTTARCNPVNAPPGCVDAALDTAAVLPLPAGYLGTPWVWPAAKAAVDGCPARRGGRRPTHVHRLATSR